ncbi:hypothetical protein [Anabaena azotica]
MKQKVKFSKQAIASSLGFARLYSSGHSKKNNQLGMTNVSPVKSPSKY